MQQQQPPPRLRVPLLLGLLVAAILTPTGRAAFIHPPARKPPHVTHALVGPSPTASSTTHTRLQMASGSELEMLQLVFHEPSEALFVQPILEEFSRPRLRRRELARAITNYALRAKAERLRAKTELVIASRELRTKNTEVLRLRGALSLRGAFEAYQDEAVRPALGLGPKDPITGDIWNAFMAKRPDVRARIEAQVPWRQEVGFQVARIYATLCGDPRSLQTAGWTVVISHQLLVPADCLASAAVLDEMFLWDFDPWVWKEQFDCNAAQQAAPRLK